MFGHSLSAVRTSATSSLASNWVAAFFNAAPLPIINSAGHSPRSATIAFSQASMMISGPIPAGSSHSDGKMGMGRVSCLSRSADCREATCATKSARRRCRISISRRRRHSDRPEWSIAADPARSGLSPRRHTRRQSRYRRLLLVDAQQISCDRLLNSAPTCQATRLVPAVSGLAEISSSISGDSSTMVSG